MRGTVCAMAVRGRSRSRSSDEIAAYKEGKANRTKGKANRRVGNERVCSDDRDV